MSDGSTIEWTDATWNPARGCDKVSPGCKHCYAETFAERWRGIKGHPFEQGFDLRLVPEKLGQPLHWKKPRKIFVNSMSDLFHEKIPNEYIAAVFGVMAATPRHTYQVLTKRAERLPDWFRWLEGEGYGHYARIGHGSQIAASRAAVAHGMSPNVCGYDTVNGMSRWRWPLPNVHLGVSCEDQQRADERIPYLLQTPAAVRWVSAEPLLGPINLHPWLCRYGSVERPEQKYGGPCSPRRPWEGGISWVVVGSESGPRARPMELVWARSIVDQCVAADVPVFTKQIANPQDRKGGDPQFWPAGVWPRQFPERTP